MYTALLVDDEQFIIDGIKAMVNWSACGVTTLYEATSYGQAAALIQKKHPTFVVSDVQIGDEKGYELIAKSRREENPPYFIMISGYDKFEYLHESLVNGAKEYLLKPINYAKLQKTLCRIIEEELGGTLPAGEEQTEEEDPVLHLPCSSFSKLVRRLIQFVQEDYGKNVTLTSAGALFRMNSRYLGQIFLNETHMRFSDYVLVYRMVMARGLIENTDAKISAIAKTVGYTNTNYFYQQFKSFYNCSPSELRQGTEEQEQDKTES